MRKYFLAAAIAAGLISCSKPSGDGPHATVSLKDGTQVAGKVTESSASQIVLDGDDHTTHTIPMTQVRSVQYDDTAAVAAAPAGAPPATAPATAPPSATSAPASAPPAAPASPEPEPAHESHYHADAARVTTKTSVVPTGTDISVRNEETIDSKTAAEGQTFAAEVTRDVRDRDGDVVIPRGANARIIIRSAKAGGKFHGASDLVLDLASVAIDGRQYALETVDLVQKGHDGVGANKRTAEFTGGGAAVGAIIGAIAGHGKGAAIGAGSGAGAGALTQILTKGGSIKVPVESVLTFKLEQGLRVRAAQ